jgi:Vam6/Vps39-like protein vacuolar protein sorting-associated protein 39
VRFLFSFEISSFLYLFSKKKRYCKRIYEPAGPTSAIFLTLLRIYLRPQSSPPTTSSYPTPWLLQPALELISRHSPRLDAVETLQILPPLVQAQDLKEFLVQSLRAPRFDVRVIREIAKARKEDVAAKLMMLEQRKVKVTDSRMCVNLLWYDQLRRFHLLNCLLLNRCPQCHKRIGHSVIAVHAHRSASRLNLSTSREIEF